MLCPFCLTENSDSATICNGCGAPLKQTLEDTEDNGLSAHHLSAGTLLKQGRYRIEKNLGEGGFGITYKGTDLQKSVDVAIKELWPEKATRTQDGTVLWPHFISPKNREEHIKKFEIEAENLSKCSHPNIVKINDWFSENGTAYIVMELIAGKTLFKILKEEGKPLPESRVKQYFIQILEALKVVHSQNLIHRDIKPDNIIVNQQDIPILIDFGNARAFIAGQSTEMTQILAPGYAPLEQYAKRAKCGPSTDFYAVCASMYHLLTGEIPPDAPDRLQPDKQLIPPSQLVSSVSPLIEQIILTGMQMQAPERFQTADEFIDALKGQFVSPLLGEARRLVKQRNLPQAVQAYEKCLASEPSNGEAAVELALVQIHLNDTQAEVAAQRAIQLQPLDGRGYGVLGLINCRKGDWSEAFKHLQKATTLSPNQCWIQSNLAWALGKSGNWQQAQKAITKALQLDSNSTFANGLQAWIALNQQQWEQAISPARVAIAKATQNNADDFEQLKPWVYPCLIIALDKAVVSNQANDLDRCIQEFINQVPDSAFGLGFQGWRQAKLNLWNDALNSFEQAKLKADVLGWVLLNLAIIHEKQQNIQDAIKVYKAYSQKFPNDAFTLFRLGTLLGKMDQWAQARTHLEKSVELKPDYAEAYHNLGWVLLNINSQDSQVENFRESISAYTKAVKLYKQQHQTALANEIKKAFQEIEIEI